MNPKKPIRVAIFASVSSREQATVDKDSLPSQLRDGRRWAKSVGGDVVAIFEVPGHSRKYIFFHEAERDIPAYARLREICQNGSFDVLWCRARDRLGRTDALIAQVEALVANADAEVYSALMPHALGQATETSSIYLSAMERASAQAENAIRAQRHDMGMKARIRNGMPASQWPYGYRPVRDEKGRIVAGEFDTSIEAVRVMTTLFLDGLSYLSIAEALNEKTPWKPKTRVKWYAGAVRYVLKSDFYAGYVHCGDVTNDAPSDKYPALWDEDLHKKVIQERTRRRRGPRPRSRRFSGIPVCARCGWRMSTYVNKKYPKKHWFRCTKHNDKRQYGPCHPNYIRAYVVGEALVKTLSIFRDDAGALQELLTTSTPNRDQLETDLRQLKSSIQSIQTKRQRLAMALAENTMTADVYRPTDDQLVGELEYAITQEKKVRTALASLPTLEDQRAKLMDLAQDPNWLLTGPANTVRAELHKSGIQVLIEESQFKGIVIKP